MRQFELQPIFINLIPDQLDEGILYISEQYGTAVHLCACGCGNKVVTPLKSRVQNGWELTMYKTSNQGQNVHEVAHKVSLMPSIGNTFACKSHYWIIDNVVKWV